MTAQERNVDFLLMGTLRGFFFNPYRPEGLQFTAGPPKSLNVSVVPAKPDTDGGGFGHGLKCRVLTSRSVASNLCSFVEQLINRKFDWSANSSVKLPFIERGEVKIDEAGRIMEGFSVPFELYPPPLQTVCDDVFLELHDGLERFLKLLRWQQEIDAPHRVFDFEPALYWRVAEGPYRHVGRKRQGGFTTRSPAGITWSEEDQREFAALWAQTTAEEPLAHELLREAKVALDASPRSALLLTATALETGVKTHAAKLVPDASWLLSEMPSPPIHKMLRRYLPNLHATRGTGLADWAKLKPLFNDAEKLAQYRNDLTHAGQMPAEVLAALPTLMNSVSDLLYVLDVLDGYQWAKECVGHKTRALLGWPGPRRQRYFVKMIIEEVGPQQKH
jgi:hypothetical protein